MIPVRPNKSTTWSDTVDMHWYSEGIIHLEFVTQKEMSMTLGRSQEYYESDLDQLRGKVFTYEQFVDAYTTDEGRFEYLHSWRGYNIPSHVLESFFAEFELTDREQQVRQITQSHRDSKYYVIGSSKMHPDVIDHELVHAYYYLNADYRRQANQLVEALDVNTKQTVVDRLKKWGYADNVIPDEINAYMSTSSPQYIVEKMKIEISEEHQKPFVELAQTVLTKEKHHG